MQVKYYSLRGIFSTSLSSIHQLYLHLHHVGGFLLMVWDLAQPEYVFFKKTSWYPELGTRFFWVFALPAEPFHALFWALNLALLCSRSRTFVFALPRFHAFALLVFRARIFTLLDCRARIFALLISFRVTGFLSRSRFPFAHVQYAYIYTPTHTCIQPYTQMYINPTHIHTAPHTYIHPHTHTPYVHTSPHTYIRPPYIHPHTHMYHCTYCTPQTHTYTFTHICTYSPHTPLHKPPHTYIHPQIHTYVPT